MHRSLHLSTWSPRFTSHNLYLRRRSLAVELNVLFILVFQRKMVVTPNYLCFYCMILKKMEKNYEDSSLSVLRCFRSTGYLLLIIAHKRMYLLFINTKEGGTQNTCPVPFSLVVYIFLVILFSFVILATSNYFQSHCFLRLVLLLSIILSQIIDIVMMSK